MIRVLVMLVLVPEFLELLDYLILSADLLVDGKQQGIEREHYPDNNP
jgi:hypothetical protein